MTVQEALDSLHPADYEQIMIGFEQETSQIIDLPDSKFIGVNVVGSPSLVIERVEGVFSIGSKK